MALSERTGMTMEEWVEMTKEEQEGFFARLSNKNKDSFLQWLKKVQEWHMRRIEQLEAHMREHNIEPPPRPASLRV
jgi:ABC-type Mn2+/Zn2+ transport system ATPase subunit